MPSKGHLAGLREWSERIKTMPEPISYIVLDPNRSPLLSRVEGHDRDGRRYVVISPAVLDEMQYRKPEARDLFRELTDTSLLAQSLCAVPVYRRQDMPEGWPDGS